MEYYCSNGTGRTKISVQEIIEKMRQYAQDHDVIHTAEGDKSIKLTETGNSIVVKWKRSCRSLSLCALEKFLENNQQKRKFIRICRRDLAQYRIRRCSVVHLYILLQEIGVGIFVEERFKRCKYSFEFYQKEDT